MYVEILSDQRLQSIECNIIIIGNLAKAKLASKVSGKVGVLSYVEWNEKA
jgi:hypothetical protein